MRNHALEVPSENLREKAYRIIKQRIINCQLAPGSALNERELVAEIGVSRTPIREALNRLEKENLVTIIPGRGSFVSSITVKEINDIYQLREIIEPYVTGLVTPSFPEERLAFYRDAFLALDQDDYDGLARLDSEFHFLIMDTAENDRINQVMANMYAQNQRIRFRLTRQPARLQETVDEHMAVIEAMLARDPLKAQEAMRAHLIRSRQAAFKLSGDQMVFKPYM
ncbi:MAG TPA: GntR family transcriptional regulator [Negativicutes bacterium]|nr:GntR family transcriptional regulator [Negativicutes bacterium]